MSSQVHWHVERCPEHWGMLTFPTAFAFPSLPVLWLNTVAQPKAHTLHLGLKVHASIHNPPLPPDASETCGFWTTLCLE